MPLRIEVKPEDDTNYALGHKVKFIDIDSDVDISDSIVKATIEVDKDDWVTANLVVDVGELKLNGVDIFKFEKKGDDEVEDISKDELNNLINRSHPYVKEIIKIYGEQGCRIQICNKCKMIKHISFPKGKTYVGPTILSSMYCQHKE